MIDIKKHIEEHEVDLLENLHNLIKMLDTSYVNIKDIENFIENNTIICKRDILIFFNIISHDTTEHIFSYPALKNSIPIKKLLIYTMITYIIKYLHQEYSIFKKDVLNPYIFCSTISALLSSINHESLKEQVMLVGILTVIGNFYISIYFPEQYHFLNSQNYIKRINKEWEFFGYNHAEIGGYLLRKYHFPNYVFVPVYYYNNKHITQQIDKKTELIHGFIYHASQIKNILYGIQKNIYDFSIEIEEKLRISQNELNNVILKSTKQSENLIFAVTEKDTIKSFPNIFHIFKKQYDKISSLTTEENRLNKKLEEYEGKINDLKDKLNKTNAQLLNIALKDPLTNTYNRRYLYERLKEEISKYKRNSTNINLIACDIDHFKKINDTYGHDNGDIVLKLVAKIMKDTTRDSDIIARTGGEEFVVICHSNNPEDGKIIAEKIRKNIEDYTFKLKEDISVSLTMSFGVSLYNNDFKNLDNFMKDADKKLYQAKNSGRNTVIF